MHRIIFISPYHVGFHHFHSGEFLFGFFVLVVAAVLVAGALRDGGGK